MKLLVILGTVRQNGNGHKVAKYINKAVESDDRFELDYADLKEVNLPLFDEDFSPKYKQYSGKEYTNKDGLAWAERVKNADAYILITPEYNHSYSAAIKNALDWVGLEWDGKAVGLVGYSVGGFGGVRAVEHLRQVVPELGMVQTISALNFSGVNEAFDENGDSKSESMPKNLVALLDEIVKLTAKLST